MSPTDEHGIESRLSSLAPHDVSFDATLTPATYMAATAMADASPMDANQRPSARALLSQFSA